MYVIRPDAGEAVVDEDVTQDDEAADITSQVGWPEGTSPEIQRCLGRCCDVMPSACLLP